MRKKLLFSGLLILFCFLQSIAQQRVITGKVIEPVSGHPIAGATVAVRGSNTATETDAEGNFTISVPNANSQLMISSVGFETREVPTAGKSDVSVSLKTTTSTLNEVVVTALGIKKQARALSYNVQEVNGDEVTQTSSLHLQAAGDNSSDPLVELSLGFGC